MKKNIIFMILAIGIGTGIGIYVMQMVEEQKIQAFQEQLDVQFISDMSVVEYGEEVLETSFIKRYMGRISSYDEVHHLSIGYQQIRFTAVIHDETYGMHEKDYFYTVKVEDTRPPILTLKEQQVEIAYGASYDPKSNVQECKDVIEGELPFHIVGEVKSQKPGTYTLYVQATDANELTTIQPFEVVVKEQVASLESDAMYYLENESMWKNHRYDSYRTCASAGYQYWKQNQFQGKFSCSILYQNHQKTSEFALECYEKLAGKC